MPFLPDSLASPSSSPIPADGTTASYAPLQAEDSEIDLGVAIAREPVGGNDSLKRRTDTSADDTEGIDNGLADKNAVTRPAKKAKTSAQAQIENPGETRVTATAKTKSKGLAKTAQVRPRDALSTQAGSSHQQAPKKNKPSDTKSKLEKAKKKKGGDDFANLFGSLL